MKKVTQEIWWVLKIIVGSAIFSLGFDLFLLPNSLNAGGISGLAQVLVHVVKMGTVGQVTAIMNLMLFIVAGIKVGKRFFLGSVIGAITVSGCIDLFALIPVPQVEVLLGVLYGGVICGLGLGIVYASHASTGGSDIIVRLLKRKWQHVPIGTINICFDLAVAALTGIAFGDVANAMYSGVALFLCGKVIDMVVYSFDNSNVAIIISDADQQIAERIMVDLERGVTFLDGHGGYQHADKAVILTAVKKYQLPELKKLVSQIDPDAFVIVQDAHQVLGDGFSRYSGDAL